MADGGTVPESDACPDAQVAERLGQVIARLYDLSPRGVLAVLAAALEDLGAGTPDLSSLSERMRADAAFWADCASPAEIEVYAAAALRAIPRKAFALAARKRLIVALWESLGDEDRRAFLSAVDPAGKFAGKSRGPK